MKTTNPVGRNELGKFKGLKETQCGRITVNKVKGLR
jgi:hypothetical protein